ncbi:MAG TPA: type 4a pilus biogenesis protein PilO [Phycisphaerales bacterium]|nr:type 4a pilus biogenesis protein PilO [Phycisphaerales bacterium]
MSASTRTIDAVGVAALLAMLTVTYLAGIRPLMRARDERTALLSRLHSREQEHASLDADLKSKRKTLDTHLADIRRAPVTLQDASAINRRLQEITTLAEDCTLSLSLVVPGQCEQRDRFGVLPITINGHGDYAHFKKFLAALNKNYRDTGVSVFELTGGDQGPGIPLRFVAELAWHVKPGTP